VTPDLIAGHAEGLIVLLGPASDVGRAVAARRLDLAAAALARWRDRAETVIEVVDHHGHGDVHNAARMLRLAREQGVPAVLTNAARYLDPADAPVAQVLDAARQLTPLGRRHLAGHNAQAYLKDSEQMARIAARICGTGSCPGPSSCPGRCGDPAHELLATTAALARQCRLDPARDLGIGGKHLPETAGGDALAQLKQRCEEGLLRRGLAGLHHPPGVPRRRVRRREDAAERLERELAIIARAGLASYFLTVADVASLIRDRGIRCAIRGSGAGCLVNYLIGISDIDPLEHDLIMERFLSEGRMTLPDIDLDVESARRIEAYRAIIERYGEERCGCVSMMETYRARSAIRDTAAALGLPPHEIDTIAKAFGHIRARGIRGALADLPELRASNLAMPQLTSLFRIAEQLDGLPRHIAMHPCGVVLSSSTLLDRVPVERSAEGLPLCQFDMDDVEDAGMIKLDVLGVRMQSAMTYALAEIERTRGERVDIDAIRPDDKPTFEMIRSGRTLGCFQIESPGQRELVTRLEPRDIGDLIVDISLFRPGPVNSDMITPFLDIKHHRRPACYPHEDLAEPLGETGGVVIFHEQVLRVIDAMTHCGFSDAERLRRKLSDETARAEVRTWFWGAARERGYDDTVTERVWEVLEAFGAFGFCKAHAAAFAIPTYQSAWLKRHYPAAFYAGVLTHDPGMYPKRVITGDARLAGIPVLPVDVNASAGDWQVERVPRAPAVPGTGSDEGLRVGLREVKGISDAEVARIIGRRPYASLRDFWQRARVSRPVTERLVLVGAFDPLYTGPGKQPTRRDLLARVGVLAGPSRAVRGHPAPSRAAGATSAEHDLDQLTLDLDASGRPASGERSASGNGGDGLARIVPAGELPELSPAERVSAELEILGIDVSQHVISFYQEILDALGVVRARDLHRCKSGTSVLVAGVKTSTQTPAVRSGQRIIFATLDDATGQMNLAFFESVQERCASRVFGSWLLVVRGRVRRPGDRKAADRKAADRKPGERRSGDRRSSERRSWGDRRSRDRTSADRRSGDRRAAERRSGDHRARSSWRYAGARDQGLAVSVNAAECWDLAVLEEIRLSGGIRAVRAAMAAGDVPGPGIAAAQGGRQRAVGSPAASQPAAHGPAGRRRAAHGPGARQPAPGSPAAGKVVYSTGFTLSPYAETGSAGGAVKDPPRKLWHASPGSSGGWTSDLPR
jgi:error-prone DNA polymerase